MHPGMGVAGTHFPCRDFIWKNTKTQMSSYFYSPSIPQCTNHKRIPIYLKSSHGILEKKGEGSIVSVFGTSDHTWLEFETFWDLRVEKSPQLGKIWYTGVLHILMQWDEIVLILQAQSSSDQLQQDLDKSLGLPNKLSHGWLEVGNFIVWIRAVTEFSLVG
jgi:hypothetical protein